MNTAKTDKTVALNWVCIARQKNVCIPISLVITLSDQLCRVSYGTISHSAFLCCFCRKLPPPRRLNKAGHHLFATSRGIPLVALPNGTTGKFAGFFCAERQAGKLDKGIDPRSIDCEAGAFHYLVSVSLCFSKSKSRALT